MNMASESQVELLNNLLDMVVDICNDHHTSDKEEECYSVYCEWQEWLDCNPEDTMEILWAPNFTLN